MALRKSTLAVNEFYHLYNRGNNKQEIFHSNDDYIRFLFCILYLQSPVSFSKISKEADSFRREGDFAISVDTKKEIISHRYVSLVAFCLMPNHFHLIVEERDEGGISKYMQRVLDSYSKYANKRYPERHKGHVFQGPYKNVRQETNEQLLYLSAYIHRNPMELRSWSGREKGYPWSSLQDFVYKNRWGNLLLSEIIASQFGNKKSYEKFVDTSTAKKEYNNLLFDDEIVFDIECEKEKRSC